MREDCRRRMTRGGGGGRWGVEFGQRFGRYLSLSPPPPPLSLYFLFACQIICGVLAYMISCSSTPNWNRRLDHFGRASKGLPLIIEPTPGKWQGFQGLGCRPLSNHQVPLPPLHPISWPGADPGL